ncbi:hypothetical protein BU25DRAFT_267144 [Macroventuria anomochaeta]|uniref:Uncharacterized protein n=1 Tax=Macroventuria anomochaeta TaxID=301207 RepID=A0ACB6S7R4_9PLEO|nr:uncharacterized protein BU25DRAFT_267144 [Macroventuria anomochaeta]KAF2630176.1 hypothetical protein BU25DRAFT_267144 [Macroventuria anomochaeta]
MVDGQTRSRTSSSNSCLTSERLVAATLLHSTLALSLGTFTMGTRDREQFVNNYHTSLMRQKVPQEFLTYQVDTHRAVGAQKHARLLSLEHASNPSILLIRSTPMNSVLIILNSSIKNAQQPSFPHTPYKSHPSQPSNTTTSHPHSYHSLHTPSLASISPPLLNIVSNLLSPSPLLLFRDTYLAHEPTSAPEYATAQPHRSRLPSRTLVLLRERSRGSPLWRRRRSSILGLGVGRDSGLLGGCEVVSWSLWCGDICSCVC